MLTDEQVIAIREARARQTSTDVLAKKYGISKDTVSDICIGRICKRVGGPRTRYLGGCVRDKRGNRRNRRCLTKQQVIDIRTRRAAGEEGKALAAEYGISDSTVSGIYTGKKYRDVGGPRYNPLDYTLVGYRITPLTEKWAREHPDEAAAVAERNRERHRGYQRKRYRKDHPPKLKVKPLGRQAEIEAWKQSQEKYPWATYRDFREWWRHKGRWESDA